MAAGNLQFGGTGGTLSTKSLYFVPDNVSGSNGTIYTRGFVADGNQTLTTATGTIPLLGTNNNLIYDLMRRVGEQRRHLGAGYVGAGTLTIDGGAVYSGNGMVGFGTNSNGLVTIKNGGVWTTGTNGTNVTVGNFGQGALDIQANSTGSLTTASLYVGGAQVLPIAGAHAGTVTVGGSNAKLLTKYTYVGFNGTGAVTINSGGSLRQLIILMWATRPRASPRLTES